MLNKLIPDYQREMAKRDAVRELFRKGDESQYPVLQYYNGLTDGYMRTIAMLEQLIADKLVENYSEKE